MQNNKAILDIWKDIPMCNVYQISFFGSVRKKLKNGKYRMLTPYKKNNNKYAIKICNQGKTKEMLVHRLLASAFNIKGLPGQVLHFKNWDTKDISVNNLVYIDKSELGKLTGGTGKRKAVAMLDKNGEVIEVYKSIRECARNRYLTAQAIWNRCSGRTKLKFASDGYQYVYDENVSYN